MTNAVGLAVKAAVHEGRLNVEYGLQNRGAHPLIAFDGAPGGEGEFPDLANAVYVSLASTEEVLVFRTLPQVPPGMTVSASMVPPVSETLPGETRKVRFSLPLPLKERSQYTPDFPGATYAPYRVRQLTVVLGWFWKKDKTVLAPFPANPKVFRLGGETDFEQFLRSSAMVDVEVLARTDPKFFRMK